MSLSDTLAEIAALQQEQSQEPPQVPPPGSPQRPNIPLVTPAPKAAPAPAPQKKSFFQSASDLLTGAGKTLEDPNTYKAIGASIVRAPGQLIGGNVDTLADLDKFASDNMVAGAVRKALPQAAQMALSAATQARKANGGASLADTLSMRSSVGQVGNPSINQGATQTLAVVGGMLAGGQGELAPGATMATKVGRLLLNSGKMGLLSATTADTTGSSTPLADRSKEAAAGAAINVVAEPLLGVVEHYIKAKLPTKVVEATPGEALQDKLDRSFATARTSEARYQAQELAGKSDELEPTEVHHLDQGTRVSDAASPDGPGGAPGGDRLDGRQAPPDRAAPGDSGGGSPEPADVGYQDANHALKAVGSTETVDPEGNPLRSDGRIPVSDASKAALDEAGMGRAFAAESEGAPGKDPVIFKEVDENGGQRAVGEMPSKADLQGFKDAATIEDLPEDHPVGQWKLSNLGASYDVPAFLRGLAEQLPEREVLNDVELMDTARKAANAIGWDPEDMIAFAAHVAGDAKQMPTAMATIRTVYARAAQAVDDLLHTQTDWTALADEHPAVRAALEAVHNIMTLGQSVAEFKSAAGQTLRVAGLPDADSYFASFGKTAAEKLKPVDPLDGLSKLPRNKDELKQWLDAWDYTKGDPQARDAFIKGLTFMPGKWMALRTSFANFYTAGIISAVATFGRDLLGPAIIGSLRTLERTTGGYAAAINPFVDAATRQDLLRTASQAPQAYLQTFGAAADALKAALRATGDGGQLLQPSTVYDLRAKTIPKGLIDAATQANPGVTGRIPYLMANVVNVFPQWIHALHGGVNEFAQRLSYLGEVRASAMLEAAQQGLQGDAFGAYVRQRLLNSTDEVTWAARDSDALASSQRTTLVKPVGGDNQPIISRVNDLVQTMRSSFPESRYILPIFTVPANAIGEGLRRLPVGALFKETQNELSGQAGAAAQAEAYGRMLSGGSFLMAGFGMARAGLITGPGPSQPKDREIWQAQGFQPYSIRIGNEWVSYNRLDVVGNLLAIPAAIYDRSVHTQLDNQGAAFAGVAALAQYFKDQSALQGVSDLMSFGGSPQESQGFLRRLANQTASGLVPNFITQLGRNNLDPDMRTARNPFEAILNKLPGASQLLDPQRNPLGEETMKVQNAAWNLLPISLTSANSYSKDPVVDELDRLYQTTGYAPGIKSPSLSGGKEDMRDIKLEDGHSLYDAVVRYRGFTTDDSGQTLRQSLQSLIDSPEYAQAADGDANNRYNADGSENRAFMVAQVLMKYDQLATRGVASDSPTAARYLAIGAIKRQNDAQLRDTPTEDIAKNPALLSALGINLGDYEDKVRGQ